MTEQEILAELELNDAKIIRALAEKVSTSTDDSRLTEYSNRQEELRAMLRQIRGQ